MRNLPHTMQLYTAIIDPVRGVQYFEIYKKNTVNRKRHDDYETLLRCYHHYSSYNLKL